jgi:hypothetical protein
MTITDIKTRQRAAAEKVLGPWWFAPKTMRMFLCRIVSRVHSRGKIHVFVTTAGIRREDPLQYAVREWVEWDPARVRTLGRWTTLAEARAQVRRRIETARP